MCVLVCREHLYMLKTQMAQRSLAIQIYHVAQATRTMHLAGWSRQIARRRMSTGLVTSPDPELYLLRQDLAGESAYSGVSRTIPWDVRIHFSPCAHSLCIQSTQSHMLILCIVVLRYEIHCNEGITKNPLFILHDFIKNRIIIFFCILLLLLYSFCLIIINLCLKCMWIIFVCQCQNDFSRKFI